MKRLQSIKTQTMKTEHLGAPLTYTAAAILALKHAANQIISSWRHQRQLGLFFCSSLWNEDHLILPWVKTSCPLRKKTKKQHKQLNPCPPLPRIVTKWELLCIIWDNKMLLWSTRPTNVQYKDRNPSSAYRRIYSSFIDTVHMEHKTSFILSFIKSKKKK